MTKKAFGNYVKLKKLHFWSGGGDGLILHIFLIPIISTLH